MRSDGASIAQRSHIGLSANPPGPPPLIHSLTNSETPCNSSESFFQFLKARKKFWLLPIIIVMLLFGGLLILAQGSAVAPFIYTLF